MNKIVEVEGKEIVLRSSKGLMAIIPKAKSAWVKEQLKAKNYAAIDQLIKSLPKL